MGHTAWVAITITLFARDSIADLGISWFQFQEWKHRSECNFPIEVISHKLPVDISSGTGNQIKTGRTYNKYNNENPEIICEAFSSDQGKCPVAT